MPAPLSSVLSATLSPKRRARRWDRKLPSRLASIFGALGLWGLILWWAVTGGEQVARLVGRWNGDRTSWAPSLFFLGVMALVWSRGTSLVLRAIRELPRVLYRWRVETWKLLVLDQIAIHIALFSTLALTVVLLDLALEQAPNAPLLTLRRLPLLADADGEDETARLDARRLAEWFCPLSRKILRAVAASLTAGALFALRTPPNGKGSEAFRLVPLAHRSGAAPHQRPTTVDECPSLLLRKRGVPYQLPPAQLDGDGLPVWTFAEAVTIDEYSWETPRKGPPERDVVAWRLEGMPARDASGLGRRWHSIHEVPPLRESPQIVPEERGARIGRSFVAPDGSVARGEGSLLGAYYRALQNPQEDRNLYAMFVLLRRLLLPVIFLMGFCPWLAVLGVELSSILGVTSLTGVAAGAALSLAKSEVLENIFAGTLISAQGNIIAGDAIEVLYQVGNGQCSVSGTVLSVGSAYLFMRGKEGHILQVPNRKVLGSVVKKLATDRHELDAFSPPMRQRGGTALGYLSRQSTATGLV